MDDNNKEVAVVRQQANKAVQAATDLVIKDAEGMAVATDVLSKIKKVAKMAKERKEAITKPLMEALNSARDLFKPIEANTAEAERIIKGKMLDYQNEVDRKAEADRVKLADRVDRGTMKEETAIAKMEQIQNAPTAVEGKVGAITTKIIKKYRVTDEKLLPREFLTPDMGKITEALKAGREVPGAEVYEEKIISAR